MKEEVPIFAIPGLGVNGGIFHALQLERPFSTIEWLSPLSAKESLKDYACRMAENMPDQPCLLIGLSFGGIVAQEIASFRPIKGIILLSSLRTPQGMPWHMHLMKFLPYYRLSRGDWRIKTLPYWGPLFGLKDEKEIAFLQEMFRAFDPYYRMWAIREMVHWHPSPYPNPSFHIHGTKDEIFPARLQQAEILIERGTHSMVFQRANEVSEAIKTGLRYIESIS